VSAPKAHALHTPQWAGQVACNNMASQFGSLVAPYGYCTVDLVYWNPNFGYFVVFPVLHSAGCAHAALHMYAPTTDGGTTWTNLDTWSFSGC
jgi:hypothetical protein